MNRRRASRCGTDNQLECKFILETGGRCPAHRTLQVPMEVFAGRLRMGAQSRPFWRGHEAAAAEINAYL